jgi:K+-sensing histidine kinase KdpD
MLALVFIGVVAIALARRGRALIILAATPIYYLCLQSAFHTEYRYILAVHYFLFVIAATALYCAGLVTVEAAGLVKREALKRSSRRQSSRDSS